MKVSDRPQVSSVHHERLLDPVLIENWMVDEAHGKRRYSHLHGDVMNHPVLGDKSAVCTSKIVWMAGGLCQTQNTLYRLGRAAV